MANTGNAHEASASAVGYLFQCRYALYAGLRAIPNDPQLEISIEKFDDVGFEAQGEPTQLIQTKHCRFPLRFDPGFPSRSDPA